MENFFRKNKNYHTLFFGAIFVMFVSIVISQTSFAEAQEDGGLVDNGAGNISTNSTPLGGIKPFSLFDIQGSIETGIKAILVHILTLVGWSVSIGSTILGWTLSAQLWGKGGFLDKEIIYDTWQIFRDLFNMFFILILLFSAFSTIFQVDKFNIKKIWLSVLLAALLINFSYPIARLVIDISNVTMFSFLNGTSGLKMSADIMHFTKIQETLMPGGYASYPIPYIIAAIIFVFILGVTLVVLGVLLMIRLLALMIIIITSPIGFAGSIFPGLGSYSSKWWDALFNYSFFGPIMVFVLMLSLSIMGSIGDEAQLGLTSYARSNVPTGQGMGDDMVRWLANAAYYFIPVAMLWMGMGIAKSLSIAGAGSVVGQGQKFSKWMGNLPKRGAKYGWKTSGMAGGIKQTKERWSKKGVMGIGGSEKREEREAKWAGRLGEKDALKKFKEKGYREDIEKEMKKTEFNTVEDLIRDMDILSAKINDPNGGATKKDYIAFAGLQRQAQSRGKDYEEARIKKNNNSTPYTIPRPMDEAAETALNAEYKNHMNNPPPAPLNPGNVTEAEMRNMQAWEAKANSLGKRKAQIKEWEKEKKEFEQEALANSFKEDRKIVKQASSEN